MLLAQVIITLLSVTLITECVHRQNNIKIENNGYSDVLIAIHEDVPENWTLVKNIQEAFSMASTFMYTATRKRAYFKNITILLPLTWSDKPTYNPALSDYSRDADIMVSTYENINTHEPRVKTVSGCGMHGENVQVSNFYFLQKERAASVYGQTDKTIVHEWAHFRWGVFDEHALHGESQTYYSLSSESFETIRCSRKVKTTMVKFVNGTMHECVIDQSNGSYQPGCIAIPYKQQRTSTVASLMYHKNLGSVNTFCDSSDNPGSKHNIEPNSQHNRLCNYRSTWDVITTTPDFINGTNPPRDINSSSLIPNFRIIRHKANHANVVLILDISGSMSLYVGVQRLINAVATFIWNIRNGTEVAIVGFSTSAKVYVPMTKITSRKVRLDILEQVRIIVSGEGSIGAGLQMALDVLGNRTVGNNKEAATFVLVADSPEGPSSTLNISDVWPNIRKAEVIIHCLAYSYGAYDQLANIAQTTGGRLHMETLDRTSANTQTVFVGLTNRLNTMLSNFPEIVLMFSVADTVNNNNQIVSNAVIDKALGYETTLFVKYTEIDFDLIVTSPTGNVSYYNRSHHGNAFHDKKLKFMVVEIPGYAEKGTWHFQLKNTDNWEQWLSMTLLTKKTGIGHPVVLRGIMKNIKGGWIIITEAQHGKNHVIGLVVIATVARPSGDKVSLQLFDNGLGADLHKNDGIYSRYFTNLTTKGHYTVTFTASMPPSNQTNTSKRSKRDVDQYTKTFPSENDFISSNDPFSDDGFDYNPEIASTTVDIIPPVQIRDLEIVHIDNLSRTVTLFWTAPGDNLDESSAAKYEIFYAKNCSSLGHLPAVSQNHIIQGSLTSPKAYGERESLVVHVPREKDSGTAYAFTVRGVDYANNRGKLSNIATAKFSTTVGNTDQKYVKIRSETNKTTGSAREKANKQTTKLLKKLTSYTSKKEMSAMPITMLIIGAIWGAGILVFLTATIVKLLKKKPKQNVTRQTVTRVQSKSIYSVS